MSIQTLTAGDELMIGVECLMAIGVGIQVENDLDQGEIHGTDLVEQFFAIGHPFGIAGRTTLDGIVAAIVLPCTAHAGAGTQWAGYPAHIMVVVMMIVTEATVMAVSVAIVIVVLAIAASATGTSVAGTVATVTII